jgi:hypothetical protein
MPLPRPEPGLVLSYQAPKSLTHRRFAHPVMPAKAGIHDLPSSQQRKSWIPAFAGMTRWAKRRWINL